jgi:hypothetical protein
MQLDNLNNKDEVTIYNNSNITFVIKGGEPQQPNKLFPKSEAKLSKDEAERIIKLYPRALSYIKVDPDSTLLEQLSKLKSENDDLRKQMEGASVETVAKQKKG